MDADLNRRYLRLYLHDDLGQADFARLLVGCGSLDALATTVEHGERLAVLERSRSRERDVERVLSWLQDERHHLLLYEDSGYPPLLRELSVPPPLLFVQGDPACLREPALAVVGSRKCSAYGRRQAHWLSSELARSGLIIISGLARGIDGAAHEAALAAGGRTIAVVGTGINEVYPVRHRELAQQIAAEGAVVSEYPLDTPPLPANFPRRNRIISGLALGTLVVEATLKSGSLISARQALEQNRDVFAVPGPIGQQQSRGCHRLIKQGAKLVEAPEDILEELCPDLQTAQCEARARANPPPGNAGTGKAAQAILAVMADQPCLYETL
ncbi:MAG: DNA-processing protein DprA, partial [Pseudohongiellaceae bacterium]